MKANLTFYILILCSVGLCGQNFTFISNPFKETIIDSIRHNEPAAFELCGNKIQVDKQGEIIIRANDSIIAQTHIDFGYQYSIHHFGYLVYNEHLYFLFFIKENNQDYAALYSYRLKDLSNPRRLHFPKSYNLNNSSLNNNQLTLKFDNRTYKINIKRNLRKERANPMYNEIGWIKHKFIPYDQ